MPRTRAKPASSTSRRRPSRRCRRRAGRPVFPPDWEAQVAAWPPPAPSDVFELVFTSGTTGTPKGVMLAHDNVVASIESFHRIVPRMEHRIVSLLPLSHLLEQAVGLFYALSVGADILYVRSRNPRVIFDALRDHRVTSMVVVPQVLDLFWSAIEREVDKRGRETAFARLRAHRPAPADGAPAAALREHPRAARRPVPAVPVGRGVPAAGAPAGLGGPRVTVLQGYGATETGTGSCTTLDDHGLGTVGRPPDGVEMRIAPDGEIQFRGPTVFKGYWHNPAATAAAFTADGWYRTGDIGHLDDAGRLILSGRIKDIIVLPNGFNVYPEDIENALRIAGIRDSVVLETQPGPDRGDRPRLGGRARRAPSAAQRPGGAPRPDRCRGQGRQRDARPEPADRRLAAVARGGLPADAHAQGQARQVRAWVAVERAAAGRLRPPAPRPDRRPQLATGYPTPSVSSAAWIAWRRGSGQPPGSQS